MIDRGLKFNELNQADFQISQSNANFEWPILDGLEPFGYSGAIQGVRVAPRIVQQFGVGGAVGRWLDAAEELQGEPWTGVVVISDSAGNLFDLGPGRRWPDREPQSRFLGHGSGPRGNRLARRYRLRSGHQAARSSCSMRMASCLSCGCNRAGKGLHRKLNDGVRRARNSGAYRPSLPRQRLLEHPPPELPVGHALAAPPPAVGLASARGGDEAVGDLGEIRVAIVEAEDEPPGADPARAPALRARR